MCLSILPAIILSGVPDHDVDKAVSKVTIAVRFGIRDAFAIAALCAAGAAALAVLVQSRLLVRLYSPVPAALIVAHAGLLVRCLLAERRQEAKPRRIDKTMLLALSFILWFCVVPVFTVSAL